MCSVRSRQKFLCIVVTQRIKLFYCINMKNELEKLSQQDKLSKFVWKQDLLRVVEIGQYFMTKDTGFFCRNSTQWLVVSTLFQGKMDHHNRKDGSRETQKLDPVLEVATSSYLHGIYGVEIIIWSLNKDSTHSWVRFFS